MTADIGRMRYSLRFLVEKARMVACFAKVMTAEMASFGTSAVMESMGETPVKAEMYRMVMVTRMDTLFAMVSAAEMVSMVASAELESMDETAVMVESTGCLSAC